MPFDINDIRAYLKRHQHYLAYFLRDIGKLLWWKICRKPIAVITTGSGGVGDYLWIRNYMPQLKQKGYQVILIAMAHWNEIVEPFDKGNYDTVRYFESCLSPRKIETFFFRIFKADVYLNFRQRCISDFVRYREVYDDRNIPCYTFYQKHNDSVFSSFAPLPEGFKHQLPIIKVQNDTLPRHFALFNERGNTQGVLSEVQSSQIIKTLTSKGYRVVFSGDMERLARQLESSVLDKVIDGKQYSYPQYTHLVNESSLVVTVNTSIYHFALQLEKPVVVISAGEYATLNLDAPSQRIVFDEELEKHFKEGTLATYRKTEMAILSNIDVNSIIRAVDELIYVVDGTKQQSIR